MFEAPQTIDIHRQAQNLAHELRSLEVDNRIAPENRKTILRFVRDSQGERLCGMRSSGRGLSPATCRKLIVALKRLAIELEIPFEEVEAEQLHRYVKGLREGSVRKHHRVGGRDTYSP